MSIYKLLEELQITLPPVATPAAAYVPFARTGNLVFLSGHISKKNGLPWTGQLGKTMQTEEGKAAVDLYTCGDSNPKLGCDMIIDHLYSTNHTLSYIER